jgi:serine/threonine protein kinase
LQEVEIETDYHKHSLMDLYKFMGVLGVGAFGVVLEACNLKTGEIVALKISRHDDLHLGILAVDIMEEQVRLQSHHPNLTKLKNILYSQTHVFIEMEKVNGGTLESFIDKQKAK